MENINNAIDVFENTYCQAVTIDECAKHYTTTDLVAAIGELTGEPVKNNDVFTVLQERGYKYILDETSQTARYIWLIKYK